MNYYTDYETALIYLTAVFCYQLDAPSPELRKELEDCPWLDQILERHSFGSVSLRWNDLRTAVLKDKRPTKGASLRQVKQTIKDLEWLTNLPLRDELSA
jgi:hypothetical protein